MHQTHNILYQIEWFHAQDMNICVKAEFAIWNTATEYRHTKIGQSILKSMSTYVANLDIAHVTLKSCIYRLKHAALHNDSH